MAPSFSSAQSIPVQSGKLTLRVPAKATLRMGASGSEVKELQARLKYIGFYQGKNDGRFNWKTHRALRSFQNQFRIKVDGVYGLKTKKVLRATTKGWAPGVENRIYRKGDQGGYVYELQGRLKYLGYYNGKLDGRFEWQTDRAVRDFQYRFGMKVDGRVGSRTKLKLWRATRGYSPTAKGKKAPKPSGMTQVTPMKNVPASNQGFSSQDIDLMAKAVTGEARGEPYEGQVAVAAVILNRLESNQFPDSPSSIIYEPLAFTAVADGQINRPPDPSCKRAVYDAVNGWDPSNGATYYFNPVTATSEWIWGRPQIKRIGKHIFMR